MDDRQEILKLAGSSIENFGKIFMGKALSAATPEFHRNIYTDLMDNSIKRLGIVAPRGHAKSTVTSILYPMWRILFKPKEEDLLILLISESQSQSVNFVSVIKHNLTMNPRIQHYFGNLEGPKWTEDEIVTSNGAKLIAKGTGQRIRGTLTGRESITRPNLIILDDFESETNSGTPEAIDKNKNWIAKAVEPSMSDDGRMIAIGTIISERAYLKDIEADESWKTHFYQAAVDDDLDTPLWPERFPPSRLKKIKKSLEDRGMGDAFWQEYQNRPINMDTQTFRPETFSHWAGEFRLFDGVQPAIKFTKPQTRSYGGIWHPMTVTVGCDLAISESHRADWTVIAPLAMDVDENRFLLPISRLKSKDIDVIVDEMIDVCIRYGVSIINIETVQFQQAVATAFRKRMLERGLYIGIRETRPRTAKDARIRSLQPLFNMGKFHHMEEHTAFEKEMISFPAGAHDDILDAVYMANMVLTPPDIKPFGGDHLPQAEYEEDESWLVL